MISNFISQLFSRPERTRSASLSLPSTTCNSSALSTTPFPFRLTQLRRLESKYGRLSSGRRHHTISSSQPQLSESETSCANSVHISSMPTFPLFDTFSPLFLKPFSFIISLSLNSCLRFGDLVTTRSLNFGPGIQSTLQISSKALSKRTTTLMTN